MKVRIARIAKRMHNKFRGLYWRQMFVTVGMVLLTLFLLGVSFFSLSYNYARGQENGELAAQAQVVGKWEDAHHVPDQKRLTWFYPDFGSYVVKEYITPEQLAVRVHSIERQEAARAHKEAKHQPPIAEQLKAAQREARSTGPRTAPKRKPLTGATDRRKIMDKKREQDFANQEALRLSGVFNTPIPAQPPEREKALDKVKEPPRVCRSLEREER